MTLGEIQKENEQKDKEKAWRKKKRGWWRTEKVESKGVATDKERLLS